MIFLSIILFPVLEIMIFIKFVQAYSFVDAMMFLFTSAVLGLFIMKMQGQATFAKIQAQLLQGQIPNDAALHSAFVLLGGFLIFIPGFISDILGMFCILPGTRHFLIWYFRNSIKKGFSRGNINVFSSGTGFGGFRRGHQGFTGGFQNTEVREERDAQVIDIEPTRISHVNKKNDE